MTPTGLVFPVGSKLGEDYDDKLLVGAWNTGSLYALPLDAGRNGFNLSGFPDLMDLMANNNAEKEQLRIGTGFGSAFDGIVDLELGPDGAVYVVAIGGSVYRITGPGPPPVPAFTAAGLAALGLLIAGVAVVALSSSRAR